ncbi:MAG: RNA polymerase sigma factor [Hymenobacteraceae bacterium]|nr:RNA polymerase sigma factor [Hymenobacteraceae bacterium]MDX5395697.1 RNA polymerase sigma factor [Hymenobacteraceae bacterium]MDX5511751.1 RNA polymerase sigma factor [Hymenobacteraceae bacterium]
MTAIEFSNTLQKVGYTLTAAAFKLTRNTDDAKDLVQETMLKALTNREKFTAGTNLKAWLFTIMRNTFINNYNKISKRTSGIDLTDPAHQVMLSGNLVARNSALSSFVMEDIQDAVARIEEEYRKPFMMYYVGYKYTEIAELLQLPIGTVKNRIHLARKELKQQLHVYQTNND